jgi:methionyl-tRNA formyltransferase
VSQPDRGRGRGRRRTPSPVAAVALDAGLPLLRPERVAEPDVIEALAGWRPDLGVVAAFGQFLPRRVRELPTEGYLINAHASILPRFRGAAPIARAILEGDDRTGISVMRVEREMDAGAVALVRTTPIRPDESCGELTGRLAKLAAEAVGEVIEQVAEGSVRWIEQDHEAATFAPKLGRDDARLDWTDDAASLARRVRAMAPRPGAVTILDGEPFRILAARAIEEPAPGRPGEVRLADGDTPLRIATGRGCLAPLRVQRAGGKPVEIAAFLRGRPIADGTVLSDAAAPESAPAS